MGAQRHLLSPGGKLAKLLAFGLPDGKFTDKPLYPGVSTLSPQPVTGRCVGMCVNKTGSLAPRGRPSEYTSPITTLQ